jgi:hypothetical protein
VKMGLKCGKNGAKWDKMGKNEAKLGKNGTKWNKMRQKWAKIGAKMGLKWGRNEREL